MSKKIKAYHIIRDRIKKEIQDAERMMANAKGVIDKAESGLNQLRLYKQEYLTTGYKNLKNPSAADLINYQGFLLNIDRAVDKQDEALVTAYKNYDRLKALWIELKSKESAMETLIRIDKEKKELKMMRKEQKEMDEFSSRIFFNKKYS